jgi:hypothetical protein
VQRESQLINNFLHSAENEAMNPGEAKWEFAAGGIQFCGSAFYFSAH